MKSTLIIGGARSGKSTMAQEMAIKNGGHVLFVATAEAGDEDMQLRIEAHRKSRPAHWTTLETTSNIGSRIKENIGNASTVVIDCITLLVMAVFQQHSGETDADVLEKSVTTEIQGLTECIDEINAHFIIVTNEIGLGIVPLDRTSRIYRDVLGRANQMLASFADEVFLLVAGIPVTVKKS